MQRIAGFLLSLFVAASALAFGPDGHRVVCQIALLELDANDRAEVIRLTRAYVRPDGEHETSFDTACNFADKARENAKKGVAGWEDFNDFDNWHFLNVPRETREASPSHCHHDCVLEGIEQDSNLLRTGGDDQGRAEGLIFLGHWLGDAHQPLHVSFRDDLGGNEILLAANSEYSGHLHRVWDSGIIRQAMQLAGVQGRPRDYAQRLQVSITSANRSEWLAVGAREWLQESYDITLRPEVEYCRFDPTRFGAAKCRRIGGRRTLTSDYQETFQPVLEKRLKQAGVRLANEIRKALHPQ